MPSRRGGPDYETLWKKLGVTYTAHGAAMVVGGLMFAWPAWRGKSLPPIAVGLFAAGQLVNLALALLPTPDIFQTTGTAVRNAGLVSMGIAIMKSARRPDPAT